MVTRLESGWGESLSWRLDDGESLTHPTTGHPFAIAGDVIKVGDYTHIQPHLISVQNMENSDKFEMQANDVTAWISLIQHEQDE